MFLSSHFILILSGSVVAIILLLASCYYVVIEVKYHGDIYRSFLLLMLCLSGAIFFTGFAVIQFRLDSRICDYAREQYDIDATWIEYISTDVGTATGGKCAGTFSPDGYGFVATLDEDWNIEEMHIYQTEASSDSDKSLFTKHGLVITEEIRAKE